VWVVSRVSRRRRLIAGAGLTVGLALTVIAVPMAGEWLVIEDALQPSRVVAVFGGGLPFRTMEAAAMYKHGWAREIWITTSAPEYEDDALKRLGVDRPPDHTYSIDVAKRLGVPLAAIHLLPEPVANTYQEIRVIAKHMKDTGGGSVILVTSKYHTRRVKILWRAAAAPGSHGVVRYARDDPFEPRRWWHNTGDVIAVAREWVGLINALAGSPIESIRD
jgi:uncharacterized SAM-binding protein YcdF (DUF218 family)